MSKSLPSTLFADGLISLAALDADAPRFAPPAQPGDVGTLGTYRVLKRLGKGGMGAVYLALDTELEREVALKVMLPRYAADPEAAGRFRREARAAAAVRHDNVVTLFQVGEHAGTPFLAMELLKGYPLDTYLKRKGRLTVAQALRVGTETALGLAAAHAHGLVHRDIKPANLWLEAPQGRIKILDFGLAKPPGETRGGTELTGSGAVMGTPAYMSPEQARGQPTDSRSDLFSLGVVLYELCAGVRPFDGPNPTAVGIAIATEEAVPLRDRNPDAPAALAGVVHRLLAKRADDRPQTAAEVARMLRDLERGVAPADLSQPAIPQVVYVPIQVTGYEPGAGAFDNLDSDHTVSIATARTLVRPRPRARFPLASVAAAVLLAAAAVGGTVYALRSKPAPLPVEPPEPATQPVSAAPAAADRELALWVFKNGGRVVLDEITEAKSEAELPPRKYAVTGVLLTAANWRLTDADVPHLAAARNLTRLECYSAHLSADGLRALGSIASAENIVKLALPLPVTPDGFDALGQFKALEHLHVTGNLRGHTGFVAKLPKLRQFYTYESRLTDDDLKPFRKAPLTDLHIQNNPGVTAAGLKHLENADLVNLLLDGTGVTGDAAEFVARQPRLKHLIVPRRAGWDDEAVARLGALTALTNLTLDENPVGDAGLRPVVAAARGLGALSVNGTAVTDAVLDAFHGRPQFAKLDATNTKVTPAGAKRLLATCPNARVGLTPNSDPDPDRDLLAWAVAKGVTVRFHGGQPQAKTDDPKPVPHPHEAIAVHFVEAPAAYKLTDANIDRFVGCAHLTTVRSDDTDLTDAGFAKLAALPHADKLKVVWLPSPRVTAAGVRHLAACTALHTLHLDKVRAADAIFDVLDGLPHVSDIGLRGCGVTDAHLARLRGRTPAYLNVSESSAVTDAGVAHLAGMQSLRTLYLNGTGVTDGCVETLVGLKRLTGTELRGTKVTAAGIKRLKAEVPTCNIGGL